ncbi:MAG: hypothetical protein FJW32_00990, partial [Acidobacteria bacterium]|nr:hypothetical protein [Acidobacteriota bacterium]
MPINSLMFRMLLAVMCLQAQEPVITTAVGTDWLFNGDGKPALDAPLGFARAVAVATDGTVYVSDPDNAIVGRIASNARLNVVAGNGIQGLSTFGGDPTSRSLLRPDGAAVDSKGRVAFFEGGVIWLLADGGAVRFAGGGTSTAEGVAAASARLAPAAIAFGPDDSLYILETGNHRVRRLSNGIVTTVAGNGSAGLSGDNGPAVQAQLQFPEGIAVGRDGVLYIADWQNKRVRRVDAAGMITTVASHFNNINGVGVDHTGRVFFADVRTIFRVTGPGEPAVVAGLAEEGLSGDGGPASRAEVFDPHSIVFDAAGNMFFSDLGNMRIRRIAANGVITTIAGNDRYRESNEGVAAVAATLNRPEAVAVATDGSLWVANSGNWSVHRRTAEGGFVRVYGNRTIGHPQRRAQFGVLIPLANGDMLTRSPFQVYTLSATGRLTTLFGSGCCEAARNGDSAATVQFGGHPASLAVAPNGDIYFGENINRHRILRVDRAGRVSIVVGTGAVGFSGDGGPASAATINYPTFFAFDRLGNFYFSDAFNNRIRRVDTRGVIATVAGNGTSNLSPDGAPATGPICSPRGIAIDGSGLLYFAEGCNGRVRRISAEGTLETVAGSTNGFSGDGGPATRARMNSPAGIAFDPPGNLYIADSFNHRIRAVLARAPSFRISPSAATLNAAGSGTIDAIPSTPGLPFRATSSENWLTVTPAEGTLPAAIRYVADFNGLEPGTRTATVTIRSGALTETFTLTANVPPTAPARLSVSARTLSFAVPKGAAEASGSITLSNSGGTRLPVSLSVNQTWLRVEPTAITLAPGQEAEVSVAISPSALNTGTFTGAVTVQPAGGEPVAIPVTLAISDVQGKLLLSQRGLAFTSVSAGGVPLPQSIGVLNVGSGSISWNVRATTLRGGDWLRVAPASGTSTANSLSVPAVDVTVVPRTLAPGEYQGQIEFVSPGAVNSPQRVTVTLQVLPPGSSPGPELSASGLIFTSFVGDDTPSQNVLVSNPSTAQAQYASGRLTFDGANWLSHAPLSAAVAPEEPGRIVVAPDVSRLAAGVYRGAITLQFFDGAIRTINVLTLVVGAEFRTTASGRGASCNPARLLPQWAAPRDNASVTLATASSLQVKVIDDCGQPLIQNGTVVARFSNGDPPVPMVHTGNGVWSATWLPARSGATRVTAVAVLARGTNIVAATSDLNANVQAGGSSPVVAKGAVLNAASFIADAPIAP